MAGNFMNNFCGFQGANVVASEYNNNGECECLGCPGCACQSCKKYKELLQESMKQEQLRLERCVNCIKQR